MVYINNIIKGNCLSKLYLSERNFNFFCIVKLLRAGLLLSNRGVCGYCYIITDIN